MIDLHCHSHFSDGVLSPLELYNQALEAQVQLLALTDHDTIAGIESLRVHALGSHITIIPGIEISTRWKKYDIHIIGLNFFSDDLELHALIDYQRETRILRAKTISQRLLSIGIKDAYSKACEVAGHEHVGRPHFARVLINEGRVSDIQSAFKRFLGRGRVGYVATAWLSLEQAVSCIKQAGGDAVIAHPLKYALTRTRLYELIQSFKAAGGTGIEVISGMMSQLQIEQIADVSRRFELLASTGSDYHGDASAIVTLGHQAQLPLNCKPIWQQWNV